MNLVHAFHLIWYDGYMNIQHFEKDISYTESERVLMARKIGKLATYCEKLQDEDSFVRVETQQRETKKKEDRVKVMLTVTLPKETLRAESRRENVIEAFDRAVEKLEPQIKRYKDEHTGRQRAHRAGRRNAN